jgi:hypothetical protein
MDDFIITATTCNMLLMGAKCEYMTPFNFLKEHFDYCIDNLILSHELVKDPYWRYKVVSESPPLQLEKSFDLLQPPSYWNDYKLYKVKLPDYHTLKKIDSHKFAVLYDGCIVKEFDFFNQS